MCGDDEELRKDFVLRAINEHRNSPEYKAAIRSEKYYKHQNPDIEAIQKIIYDMQGKAHTDTFSPNHKLANNYYFVILAQSVSYLLANGVAFKDENVKRKLGANFDGVLRKIFEDAKNSGVGYGFYTGEKVVQFKFNEFKAIPDDYTSVIKAGVRFTQIDDSKPLMATLYEIEGYTEYKQELDNDGKPKPLEMIGEPRRRYNTKIIYNDANGVYEETGENFSVLPIYPLYNLNRQSELIGNLEILIALDIVMSNLINNVSQGELIYWVLKNYGGMDDIADANFIINLLKTKIVHINDNGEATPHTIQVPVEASAEAIAQLRKLLFDNLMGVDTERLSGGSLTATEIKSAYSNLKTKSNLCEYEVREFINGIMRIAGIDENEPYHFTPDGLINTSEELQNVLSAYNVLGDEATTKKVCELLGMIDDYESIMKSKAAEDLSYFTDMRTENGTEYGGAK